MAAKRLQVKASGFRPIAEVLDDHASKIDALADALIAVAQKLDAEALAASDYESVVETTHGVDGTDAADTID